MNPIYTTIPKEPNIPNIYKMNPMSCYMNLRNIS